MLFHKSTETFSIETKVQKKDYMNKKNKEWLNVEIIINKRKKIIFWNTIFM